MRRVPAALLLASAVTIGACQQKSPNEAMANDQMAANQNLVAGDTSNAMTNASATAIDAAFLTETMKGDNGEVAIGNLAAEKASSSAAKDFGRMLATDHGSHKQKLAELALSAGVPATDEPTDEGKANLDRLKGLSRAAFDKEFARMMLEDHQEDIAKYEKQASRGDPQTAALAKETLPVLRKHLETARGL